MELQRYDGNPLLCPTDNWWENKAVFNCAAALLDDREHAVAAQGPLADEARQPVPGLLAAERPAAEEADDGEVAAHRMDRIEIADLGAAQAEILGLDHARFNHRGRRAPRQGRKLAESRKNQRRNPSRFENPFATTRF